MPACLITATNRGIGFELARVALAEGWTVYGSVRSQETAQRSADQLGAGYVPIVFDVTDHSAVGTAAAELSTDLDLLINNAGIITPDRQTPLDMKCLPARPEEDVSETPQPRHRRGSLLGVSFVLFLKVGKPYKTHK